MTVTWTESAQEDILKVFSKMSQKNEGAAAKQDIECLFALTERLAATPHAGKPGVVENTRELSFPSIPYTLFLE